MLRIAALGNAWSTEGHSARWQSAREQKSSADRSAALPRSCVAHMLKAGKECAHVIISLRKCEPFTQLRARFVLNWADCLRLSVSKLLPL